MLRIDKTSIAVLAMALLALGVIALSVYKPAPEATSTQTKNIDLHPNYYIRIKEASWGMNCDKTFVPTSAMAILKGKEIKEKTYKMERGNVTEPVAVVCEGKKTCTFSPKEIFILQDPAPDCSKDIIVTYTCFSYDKPWKTQETPDKPVTIDCNYEKAMSRSEESPAP